MKMKKILALLASAVLAFGASAYAQSFTAVCDSQKGEVKVSIKPDAEYSAPIMVYLTTDGVAVGDINADNIDEAVKLIAEVAKGANGYEATLKLPADIEGGYYTFTIADYAAENDAPQVALEDRQCVIYVADSDEVNEAIAAVNGASATTIGGVFTEYKDALSISTDVDFGESTNKAFVALRGSKTYETLEEIQSDYAVAQAIGGLTDATKLTMGAKLTQYAGVLGIGLDEDYTANAEDAHALMAGSFDASVIDANVIETYKTLAKEAVALATLNNSNRTEIDAVLVKYEDVFDVDLDGKYASTDKVSFNKALERRNFATVKAVKDAFDAAVKALDKKTSSGGGSGSSSISYSPQTATPNTPVVPDGSFTDLNSAEWAREAIEALSDKGVVAGYADGSFGPNNNITRNEFISIIVRAFGLMDETAVYDFTDGDASAWYAQAIASAKKAGILAGYADGSFGDGSLVTREDMAAFIYRMGKVEKAEGKTFADAADIADYAKEAVDSLATAGIINGMDEENFVPKANATRAQAARIIYMITGGEANE